MPDPLRSATVCSGVGCWEVANPEMQHVWCSEIEKFPAAVLAARFPETPNFGDLTVIATGETDVPAFDLLCGGTPCQSFSLAGLRKGMADPRGNLALGYVEIARRHRPCWLVWENVPGVLSSNGGRDFGAFLGALAECGYGFAYRVLDAQYFGLAQRRKRVFVVGYLGDWRPPAAVLFEPESLRGDPAPRREPGKAVAALTGNGVVTCGADDNQGQAGHLIAHTLRGEGFDASEDGTGRGTPLVPVAFGGGNTGGAIDVAACLTAKGQRHDFEVETMIAEPMFTLQAGKQHAVAFDPNQITSAANRSNPKPGDPVHTIPASANPPNVAFFSTKDYGADATEDIAPTPEGPRPTVNIRAASGGSSRSYIAQGYAVRRLTPHECERLQGLPDDHTRIPWRGRTAEQCPDGPRYKAIGNGMAVPVMRWIGQRIGAVDAILKENG